MASDLRTPTVRECERCRRREEWDGQTWRIAVEDGTRHVGDPYCVHEWDINGTFVPFE